MATGNTDYQKYSVLVLEDDAVCRHAVQSALDREFSKINLLCAKDIKEAKAYLEEGRIDFYVLDINLPDGSGIDLLVDIKANDFDAQVVMITATPLPQYCKMADSMGVLQFIVKPFYPKQICNLFRQHLKKLETDRVENANKPALFSGALSGLTALDIIQLKCLSGVTQALDFVVGKDRGRIYFKDGNIIHAQTLSASGVEAIKEIMSSQGGEIVEVPNAPQCNVTITQDWQSLLLEAVQAVDEDSVSA